MPIIVAVALAAVAPMLVLGPPDGHDLEFHVTGWADTAQQWRAGVWAPRWAQLANFGFGEPRFVFYPPLSRALGAALITLLPPNAAPGAYFFVAMVLAGAAMFVLVRQWLPPGHAVVAAAFYAVNPYILLCVYQRSAFAELLANALCPLLLAFALRLPAGNRAIVPLAATFGLCWISDLPAAVILSYTLAAAVAIMGWLHRSRTVFARGVAAMMLGFALVAFFVVPAAYEQRWVNIAEAISPDFQPQNWEYTWDLDAEAGWFYAILSGLVYAEIFVAIAAGVASWSWRRRHRTVWWAGAALAVMAIVMLLPVSHFAWQHLPKLEFVQFPWRWLLVLSVCVTLLVAASLARWRAHWLALGMLIIALAGGIASGATALWHRGAVSDYLEALREVGGYEGSVPFMPRDASPGALYALRTMPEATATGRGATVRVLSWAPEHKAVAIKSAGPTDAVLRLLNYPAWRATVNGHAVAIASDKSGRAVVPVPGGSSRVEVTFTRTADRSLGIYISFLAALLLAGVAIASRRTSDAAIVL